MYEGHNKIGRLGKSLTCNNICPAVHGNQPVMYLANNVHEDASLKYFYQT